jgi:hypothetical protein
MPKQKTSKRLYVMVHIHDRTIAKRRGKPIIHEGHPPPHPDLYPVDFPHRKGFNYAEVTETRFSETHVGPPVYSFEDWQVQRIVRTIGNE